MQKEKRVEKFRVIHEDRGYLGSDLLTLLHEEIDALRALVLKLQAENAQMRTVINAAQETFR
jgi:hypothetical protein